jgi:SAM-dependent methyltransferase
VPNPITDMMQRVRQSLTSPGDPSLPEMPSEEARFIAAAFLVVLGREVGPIELRDTLRGFRLADGDGLIVRLLSSPEFRLLRDALKEGRDTGRDPDVEERGLRAIGQDDRFVRLAYECLFGRPADPGGFQHFTGALAAGETRANLLRSLILSDEFGDRYRRVSPEGGVVPRDTQLCELANPAKWDNPEWTALLRDLGLPDSKLSMHRKCYEFTQLVYGLRALGFLRDDVRVVSVGAGHEAVLYWLANHVGLVVATDLYEGVWQDVQAREGDAGVLHSPAAYAPFPYREDRLIFMQMDALGLGLATERFDVAYSLSSVEHFGGVEGACRAVDEMARLLKPGGVLALATELVIAGPPHDETFLPEEVAALVSRPGLRLVSPLDTAVYNRYEYAAVDLYRNPHQTPHMVVRFNDTVFTTVFAFLRKERAG